MTLINYHRYGEILILLMLWFCGLAQAGIIVSAGQEYNYTFDFSDQVLVNGPGRFGFEVSGQCLTEERDAQIWLVDVPNVAGGTYAQSGILCNSAGERFSTYSNFGEDNGIVTVSLRYFQGAYSINSLFGSFDWPPLYSDSVIQVAVGSYPPTPPSIPAPQSLHLLLIFCLMLSLKLVARPQKN